MNSYKRKIFFIFETIIQSPWIHKLFIFSNFEKAGRNYVFGQNDQNLKIVLFVKFDLKKRLKYDV